MSAAPQWDGPPRPLDTWRVCGRPVDRSPSRGCTCPPNGPSALVVIAARKRLEQEGARA